MKKPRAETTVVTTNVGGGESEASRPQVAVDFARQLQHIRELATHERERTDDLISQLEALRGDIDATVAILRAKRGRT